MTEGIQVEIEGKELTLTNLDKVLYPAADFKKSQVIDYYTRIGPVMVPHLKGRPLTLKRYPDGVREDYFYEKECPAFHPDWVDIATIESKGKRPQVDYCMVDNLPSLVWVANLASLEMHTLLARMPDISRPTMMVFDLDPGEGAGILDCAWAALELKGIFDALGLDCVPKTSGGKGIHVLVPLNTTVSFEDTKTFAHAIAMLLERKFPDEVTSIMRKKLRKGRILVDWSQNDRHKTTVCVYSLRAREHPVASTPLTWDEMEAASEKGDGSMLVFEAEQVLNRVEEKGDLFLPALTLEQTLPDPQDIS